MYGISFDANVEGLPLQRRLSQPYNRIPFGFHQIDQQQLATEFYEADASNHPEEDPIICQMISNNTDNLATKTQEDTPLSSRVTILIAQNHHGRSGAKSNLHHHSTYVKYRIREKKQGTPRNLF